MIESLYPERAEVATTFSRSAAHYDSVAVLQRHVATRLQALCAPQHCVVDLGCGTGVHTAQLADHRAVTTCYGIDIAEGMLRYANAQRSQNIQWLQSDACNVPLASHSVDHVFSSLMVQWLGASQVFFSEIQRLLKPGGTAAISTLVEGSLHEVKTAWQQVDDAVHVNHFEPTAHWLAAANDAGLSLQFYQTERYVRQFDSSWQVLKDLNVLGAKNLNQGRRRGLTGRRRFVHFAEAYEPFRAAGKLPCRYNVLYMVLRKHG